MNRKYFLVLLIFFLHFSCKQDSILLETQHEDSLNKLIEIGWNQKDLTIMDSIFATNATRTVNNVKIAGNHAELLAMMNIYFTGFPDLILVKHNSLNKNNQTFFQWTITGTNTGVYGEKKATGKKVKIRGFTRVIFNDAGKIVQEDIYYNELEFLQQLGYTLVPPIVE